MLHALMSSDLTRANPTPLLVLVNPAAGGGRGREAGCRLVDALRELGVHCTSVETNRSGHAKEIAATQMPGQVVVSVGGDGTAHETLNGLPIHDGRLGPMAVLPCGSGDDFASSLGLSRDPASLARTLTDPRLRRIDVGIATYGGCDGHVRERFANSASLGFDGEVAAEARKPHRLRGRIHYAMSMLRALRRNPSFVGAITIDDGEGSEPLRWSQELSLVATGNGQRLGGGLRAWPQSRIDDGLLDVLAVAALPRPSMLWLFAKLVTESLREDRRIQTHRGRRINVESDRPIVGALDGEALPLDIRAIRYEIAAEPLWMIDSSAP
jgi:diacylglycerol kinase (ATP)